MRRFRPLAAVIAAVACAGLVAAVAAAEIGPSGRPRAYARRPVGSRLRSISARSARVNRNPFRGARLYVDPDSAPAEQARSWAQSRPGDAQVLSKLAAQPQADWFDQGEGIQAAVAYRVTQVTRAGALPVLVAYFIPHRDCGAYSGGGASSSSAYRRWTRALARGIGSRRAVVLLEPDALADLDCLSPAAGRTRVALLRDAARVLSARPGISVYLDAGNSAWQPAATIAARLRQAGVADVRGFSLNVSNFNGTFQESAYGHLISQAIGGKPFVIDTSRNGQGPAPDNSWCNPPGRGLGHPPTSATGDPLIDAFLWIKAPGESDGSCGGAPAAGEFWPDYALGLAERASF